VQLHIAKIKPIRNIPTIFLNNFLTMSGEVEIEGLKIKLEECA